HRPGRMLSSARMTIEEIVGTGSRKEVSNHGVLALRLADLLPGDRRSARPVLSAAARLPGLGRGPWLLWDLGQRAPLPSLWGLDSVPGGPAVGRGAADSPGPPRHLGRGAPAPPPLGDRGAARHGRQHVRRA